MHKAHCLSSVLSQAGPFGMSPSRWCLLTTSRLQTIFVSPEHVIVGGGILHVLVREVVSYCHIGSKDFYFFFSSVRCLPSFDLRYFCCVPRGMNSPSINISIVISAGRPRVTFRKMSWNWFLTFISQSGWGLFLARRVFIHPTRETILKLKGYSVSARGLAQFFCNLVASLGKKWCAR